MKLDNKTNYFDYFPGESILVAREKPWLLIFLKRMKRLHNVFL
jgi:hypothetical protein